MVTLLKKLAIFRRLFLAFLLAALFPASIMIIMITVCIQVLQAHGIGSEVTGPLLVGTIIAIVISSLLVMMLSYFVNLTITQPLRQLVALTQRIRRGDTSARVTITGQDEISLVGASMNTMLSTTEQLLHVTQSQRDYLQTQVEKLIEEVSGVGEGDLRIQAEVTTDSLGVLADCFNFMVEELSNLVIRVKVVTQQIVTSTMNTSEQMAQLVAIAQQQSKHVTIVTREIEHTDSSSRFVAERVKQFDQAASEARDAAHAGRGTVQQTVQGMEQIQTNVRATAYQVQRLDERSQQVDKIIAGISGIAHQTNRLALDAAIQAAVAGENGTGFAAIATDIRRLAEQTKAQTGSMTQVVRSIREDIGSVAAAMHETERETETGAQLIQATGTSLTTIFVLIDQQADAINTSKQVILDMLTSLNRVAQSMRQVSQAMQQSNTSTHIVAQNMEQLTDLAEQLRRSIEVFHVKEQDTSHAPSSVISGALHRGNSLNNLPS